MQVGKDGRRYRKRQKEKICDCLENKEEHMIKSMPVSHRKKYLKGYVNFKYKKTQLEHSFSNEDNTVITAVLKIQNILG